MFGFEWDQGRVAPFRAVDEALLSSILATAQARHPRRPLRLVDLGCGDGRVCRAAALDFGMLATGVEIDAELVEAARSALPDTLSDRVSLVCGDLLDTPLSSPDSVRMCGPRPTLFRPIRSMT